MSAIWPVQEMMDRMIQGDHILSAKLRGEKVYCGRRPSLLQWFVGMHRHRARSVGQVRSRRVQV